uniref:Uncharacterized protein n=1 Tax=Arion vulgaris TaxID=1028688 RepID=A0A0B6Z798_9EUPU
MISPRMYMQDELCVPGAGDPTVKINAETNRKKAETERKTKLVMKGRLCVAGALRGSKEY